MEHENISQHQLHQVELAKAGLRYAYLKAGEGELVICLHGFPDFAFTWDETIEALSEEGYCVVAPFLRGYYPTALAPDDDYSIQTIAQDILELMDQLGYQKARVIGQDWGASVAYAMANLSPKRVQQIVTIAIPHPSVLKPSFRLLWKARHFLLFGFKRYALWYTRRKNFAYIDYLLSYWSPNWQVPAKHREYIKRAFALDGRLEAALGYYLCAYKDARNKERQLLLNGKVKMPARLWAGSTDVIDISQVENLGSAYESDFKLEFLEGPGHFLHQEAPGLFIARTKEFFAG